MSSDRNKSHIYLDALPMLNSSTAVLLDDPRLIAQLSQLERRAVGTGQDSVDHMRGALVDRAAVRWFLLLRRGDDRGNCRSTSPPPIIPAGTKGIDPEQTAMRDDLSGPLNTQANTVPPSRNDAAYRRGSPPGDVG